MRALDVRFQRRPTTPGRSPAESKVHQILTNQKGRLIRGDPTEARRHSCERRGGAYELDSKSCDSESVQQLGWNEGSIRILRMYQIRGPASPRHGSRRAPV